MAVRYRLAPDAEASAAIEATFDDYRRMMDMLDEIAAANNIGSNLVKLHAHAYEAIRKATRLPSRLVSLGLRDRANYRAAQVARLPLDERLVNVKNASTVSLGTALGRFSIAYDVVGYEKGWGHSVPAQLVRNDDGNFEIRFGVTTSTTLEKETNMMAEHTPAPDTILSRAGRLIAGIAYGAIERAEDSNKVAVVKQAIREIEAAEKEARDNLAQARAEEYRLGARRGEIDRETTALAEKIRLAISEQRDDLAAAGIARQMDLEAQFEVLSKAIDENSERIDTTLTTLRAILSGLQDAEIRLHELEASESGKFDGKPSTSGAGGRKGTPPIAKADRAARAIARATGIPASVGPSPDIDELSKLHRDKEIASRLARLKSEL
ncbi:MAG TPA: PspA/IM30 family protein [Bradyrhizobium sp.]|nr:PspA/IM30 family protein [Bradyrhizobium sp.]